MKLKVKDKQEENTLVLELIQESPNRIVLRGSDGKEYLILRQDQNIAYFNQHYWEKLGLKVNINTC